MEKQKARHARFIKLGSGGRWAANAILEGKLRFGWENTPLVEMLEEDWPAMRARGEAAGFNKSAITNDLERLKDLLTSRTEDLWITFHDSRLWWARVGSEPVAEDSVSRFRTLTAGWTCVDIMGIPLVLSRVPGTIAQLQGFRGTVCRVHDSAALLRLINGEESPEHRALSVTYEQLVLNVSAATTRLHWKDFEILVDLVFRQAGWRRRSMLGGSMKHLDLDLIEPITGLAYMVQVKSRASVQDFHSYADQFTGEGYERLYFIVHTPDPALAALKHEYEGVELVLPDQLARLVIDGGLVGWILDKVR